MVGVKIGLKYDASSFTIMRRFNDKVIPIINKSEINRYIYTCMNIHITYQAKGFFMTRLFIFYPKQKSFHDEVISIVQ